MLVKYNEFGQWVASNLGSWGTATTSKWGNAWKKVMDHFGNISMTLTSTDDYLDIDNFLKTGQIKAGLEANPEACGQTCFYWYYEYSKKDYAHKSAGTSSSNQNTQPSTGSSLLAIPRARTSSSRGAMAADSFLRAGRWQIMAVRFMPAISREVLAS